MESIGGGIVTELLTLRPQQAKALSEVHRLASNGSRKILVTLPTRGGKSLVMRILATEGGPSATYTNRSMLFDQLSREMTAEGISHGLRAAGKHAGHELPVQLCMTQTEGSRCLREKNPQDVHYSDRLLIDEAHVQSGAVMESLRAKHRVQNPDVLEVGFTATPLGIGHAWDELVVAGRNSDLRAIGALVPAITFAPDEPDEKWIGKVCVDKGECGIKLSNRMKYMHQVVGSAVEHCRKINPEQRPMIAFCPGVAESKWAAMHFTQNGIPSAHIDGESVWVDGQEYVKCRSKLQEVHDRMRDGDLKLVSNRFCLREGISWNFISHAIFMTVFGSLTSYLQSGGRVLGSYPGKDFATIQDHGANRRRHGDLNDDQEWSLEFDDRIMAGKREQDIRDEKALEPITCPECFAMRLSGPECPNCGFRYVGHVRRILQKDGTLKIVKGRAIKPRRKMSLTEAQAVEKEWGYYIRRIAKSEKPTVQRMTFSQAEVNFALRHNWKFPPRTLKFMPIKEIDWYRPVSQVPIERLRQ